MAKIYLLYCLSGFVSLGYQVVWFRIYADRFGSTNLTFVLVLCNFILGLGAGALASRRLTDRLATALHVGDRLRLYGIVEGGDLAYVEERVIADGPLAPRLSARLSRYIG